MRQISTVGIILKKHNFNEHDQFVVIFSPILGKFEAKAKGSRKIDSSFTGHLEILNICKFQLYNKNQHYTITQCQSKKTFKALRNNLEKSMLAQLMLEIFQRTTSSPENGEELFNLLENSLNLLSRTKKTSLCVENFKIKLLDLLGILPDISKCSSCHWKWSEKDTILLQQDGQIICIKCQKEPATSKELPFKLVKLINYICKENPDNILKILLKPQEEAILKTFSSTYFENYLNHEINTEKIISTLATPL